MNRLREPCMVFSVRIGAYAVGWPSNAIQPELEGARFFRVLRLSGSFPCRLGKLPWKFPEGGMAVAHKEPG